MGEDRSISNKLSDLLREVLTLANVQFVEAPKVPLESQASDADIQAFHSYMQRQQ